MEMQDAVKKYWPWLLGGAVGIYLLTRGGSAQADPVGQVYAAQMQNASQNAAIGAAQRQAEMQYSLQSRALDSQEKQTAAALAAQMSGINAQLEVQTQANANALTLGMAELAAQAEANKMAGAVALADVARQSQSEMAGISASQYLGTLNAQTAYAQASGVANLQAAQGASQIVAQLQQPLLVGLQAAAAENIAAIGAAGQIAAAGFGSQANQIASVAQAGANYGNALALQSAAASSAVNGMAGSIGDQIGSIMRPVVNPNSGGSSPLASVANTAIKGATAYYTGMII